MIGDVLPREIEAVATVIVDAAYTVHKELGPGLLESIYEECLAYELTKRGLKVERQVPVPIIYDGQKMSHDLKLDLLVESSIIVETKAVEQMHPIHETKLHTYLKLSQKRLGFLINFHVVVIRQGIKRIIH